MLSYINYDAFIEQKKHQIINSLSSYNQMFSYEAPTLTMPSQRVQGVLQLRLHPLYELQPITTQILHGVFHKW